MEASEKRMNYIRKELDKPNARSFEGEGEKTAVAPLLVTWVMVMLSPVIFDVINSLL
jgi:hypothetical protein